MVVSTDVAARGLDIPSVSTVVHYDIARAVDTFVHRSGRTAVSKIVYASCAFVVERIVDEEKTGFGLESLTIRGSSRICRETPWLSDSIFAKTLRNKCIVWSFID